MGLPYVSDPEIRNMSDEEAAAAVASLAADIDAEKKTTYQPIRSPLDNVNIRNIQKQKQRALEQGGFYVAIPEDEKQKLEEGFNSDTYYSTEGDKKYQTYVDGFNKFKKAGDAQGAQQWNQQYQNYKAHINFYQDSYDCTFGGRCEEGKGINFLENQNEEWRYDDMSNNIPLLKSLRRTYGSYDDYGNERTDEQLIKKFMTDQTFLEFNFGKKGVTAAKLPFMTDQEVDDLALQYLTYTKIKGAGEGSRSKIRKTVDVVGAVGSDPFAFTGISALLRTAGTLLGGKELVKEITKKGLRDYFSKRIKSKVAKSTLTGIGVGSGYMGFDALAKEQIVITADLQDKVDWGKVGFQTGMGGIFGGSFGALVGGASKAFNALADRYMLRNNLNNKAFLEEMSTSVTDPKSLFKWLKKIGWSKEEAKAELTFLEKNGFKFAEDKGVWVTKDGKAEYKTPAEERLSEQSLFGDEVDESIVPRPLAREAEEKLDDEFIDVTNIDAQIPFSKLGQRAFDWLDNSIGATAMRTIYGGDALLVRSGQRKFATAMKDAQAATDINVSRISHELNSFKEKNAVALGDINALIRSQKATNAQQAEFLKLLNSRKDEQLRAAWKNKVIKTKDYNKFKEDPSYIPRVWNTQRLITTDGAREFSNFISDFYKRDSKVARDILTNLTGKKETTDGIINSGFSANKVRNMFRNKADREMDVHRSSHLEHERKLSIPAKYEHRLDQFMAAPLDRWSTFFDDVIKRNEFARRFGAKDQKVHKQIKKLEEEGRGRAAGHLRETYFTNMGDKKFSDTVRKRMESPRLMKGVAKINAFQNLKLGLAAIPNATQSFVNGTVMLAKSGSILTAPFKAMNAIIRANVKTTRDMDIIHRAGVLGETDLARIATENMPHSRIVEKEFTGGLQYLNEPTKFLRAVGFIGVENMNRRAAAIMAHGHVASVHSKLQRLKLQGKSKTGKARKLERELKELGVNDPHKADLSARDYAISGHMFNKHVNFSGETFNIPSNWQTPWFKLFTKFKSFMFYQARFLKRNVTDELFLHHNPKPLMAYMAAAGVAGNMAEMTRALATGREIEANRDALELLITGIGNAGGSGLWWDTMQQVAERGPGGAWSSIMGPTFSDVAYTAQDLSKGDIDKIIKRMLPNLPGKQQLYNEWRDQ